MSSLKSWSLFSLFVLSFCLLTYVLVAATPVLHDQVNRRAVAFSAAVAGLNAISAFGLTLLGNRARSTRGFFLAVLGGMGARLVVVLTCLVVGIKLLHLPTVALAVSFLAYLTVLTAVEFLALHHQTRRI